MDLKDNQSTRFIHAFQYAVAGVIYAFKTERNFKIHSFAAILALLFAYFFSVTRIEWMLLILVIGMTMTLELINTALENVVNLITVEWHPLAKAAKDVAAGAVLVSSLMSVIIGLIIFIPRLIELFN